MQQILDIRKNYISVILSTSAYNHERAAPAWGFLSDKFYLEKRRYESKEGCVFEVDAFFGSLGSYSEVDVLEGCTKQRKNVHWGARFVSARTPARNFERFCAAALKNVAFRVKTKTSKLHRSKRPPAALKRV